MQIGYIGNSFKIAEYIIRSNKFELKAIICEECRLNKEMILLSEFYDIDLYIIKNKYDLPSILKVISCSRYLMYSFGIIIPNTILEVNNIFNIHPGSLENYRGRNPIEKAILNCEKNIDVTLYKICSKIDLGEVISIIKLPILFSDDNITIQKKIEELTPIFIDCLYSYLLFGDKLHSVDDGVYLKRVEESDYTIDLNTDSLIDIYSKIKSQKKYRGAILKYMNENYRVLDIHDIKLKENFGNSVPVLLKNKLIFCKDEYNITLIVKKEDDGGKYA